MKFALMKMGAFVWKLCRIKNDSVFHRNKWIKLYMLNLCIPGRSYKCERKKLERLDINNSIRFTSDTVRNVKENYLNDN